jgi:hypothetical protein
MKNSALNWNKTSSRNAYNNEGRSCAVFGVMMRMQYEATHCSDENLKLR